MLSKRANIFYIEHAKIIRRNNAVVWVSKESSNAFNIPDKNTMFILLGTGTSLSSEAARLLSESGVLVGFTGSGGSPLHMTSDISFFTPLHDYRPTKYMQQYIKKWNDLDVRLAMGKQLLTTRVTITQQAWVKLSKQFNRKYKLLDFECDDFIDSVNICKTSQELLAAEARFSKLLYHKVAKDYNVDKFRRVHDADDYINKSLNQGNSIMYGYASVVLHSLGVNFSFPVLHGLTNKGALVYDVADVIKDAFSLPLAFEYGIDKITASQYKSVLINTTIQHGLLDTMYDFVKKSLVQQNQ